MNEPAGSSLRVVLVVNPTSGDGRAARGAHALLAALLDAGVDSRVVVPSDRDGTREAAAAAVSAGAHAVIACGGDGTVHDVLQELAGTSCALGVVSAGSGDDIAGGLGCSVTPASVPDMVRQLTSDGARVVDLGRVIDRDGRSAVFASVLCTGFDARVNARANALPRLAGQRYTVAMMTELSRFRPLAYRITLDGVTSERESMIVTIGNGDRYGGGMRICPEANVSDGLLDITILDRVSRPRLVTSFRLVYPGRHVELPFVHTARARDIRIECEAQVAYADGERVGPLPVQITALPKALRVISCD